MTGDGANDAPALKRADIGFAMGSGTEIAKESGDIVILDDNFSSITKAVLYGRTIYRSIRRFIVYQVSVNVAALVLAFVAPFTGQELPLTMIQMLWVNLVMDTLAAMAFGGEPALEEYMQEAPKKRSESIVSKDMLISFVFTGLVIASASLIFLNVPFFRSLFTSEDKFMTAFFAFFMFMNVANMFNARVEGTNLFGTISQNENFLKIVGLIIVVQVIITYVGGEVLRTVPLNVGDWLPVVALSLVIIPIDLLRKLVTGAGKLELTKK